MNDDEPVVAAAACFVCGLRLLGRLPLGVMHGHCALTLNVERDSTADEDYVDGGIFLLAHAHIGYPTLFGLITRDGQTGSGGSSTACRRY